MKEKESGIQKNSGLRAIKNWEWALLIAAFLFFFVSFIYKDLIYLVRNGINVAGSIFEGGGVLNYYVYNDIKAAEAVENGYFALHAYYNFFIYIIMGIWQFPLWLIGYLFQIDPAATDMGMLYGKAINLFFLYFSGRTLRKISIASGVSEKNSYWGLFLFYSSLLLISSVDIMGQSDIIVVLFILLGVNALLQKKFNRFVLWFAFAIACKPFAAITFIPLLLLYEKKIWKILLSAVTGVSVGFIFRMIFVLWGGVAAVDADPNTVVNPDYDFMFFTVSQLLQIELPVMGIGVVGTGVPLMVAAFSGVCIYSYFTKVEKKDLATYAIYIALLANVLFSASFNTTPYRMIYIVPFTMLIIMTNIGKIERNMLLETVAAISLTLSYMLGFYWCYDATNVRRSVWGNLYSGDMPYMLTTFYQRFGVKYGFVFSSFGAIYLACIVAFLYFNRPSALKKEDLIVQADSEKYFWYRAIVNIAICIFPVLIFFFNAAIA